MSTPAPTLRGNSDVVNDWSTLQAGTLVHRYHDGELMYGGQLVRVVWVNSDHVGVNLPDLLDGGHDAIKLPRGDRDDPRKGNQLTRA